MDTLLKKLEAKYKCNFDYLGKGWRSVVFYNKDKKIVVKIYKDSKKANKEWEILKKIENLNIAPRAYELGENYIVMEYIDGVPLEKFDWKPRIKEILDVLYKLDKIRIDQGEMHRPLKHIIFTKRGIRIIDFERAKEGVNIPKFFGFLISRGIINKREELFSILKKYKKDPEKYFRKLLSFFD